MTQHANSTNSTNSSHTPGPWKTAYGVHVVDKDGTRIADVCDRWDSQEPYSFLSSAKSNARLIAAAPELLAALELIYSNAEESPEWIRDRIQPAIAKAKGA
jgi:hypothetical protein